MRHFLVTRYNLGLYDRAADPGAWMRERAALFAEHTLPSVRAQQGGAAFEWLLFLDARTPDAHLALVPDGPYRTISCDVRWRDALPDAAPFLRRHLCAHVEPGERVVTQRLDNDDAIDAGLVALVGREAVRASELPCVLDPVHGAVVELEHGRARVSPWRDPMSGFIAFVERMPAAGEPLTVWADAHRDMGRHGRRIVLETDAPAWRQVWHGSNLWNGGEASIARRSASREA